jgi:hypothetical protein
MAMQLTSDFDGDQIAFLEYTEELEPLFTEARLWATIPNVTKTKRASDKSLGEIAVTVMQSALEVYASLITGVYTRDALYPSHLKDIAYLASRLQSSVDAAKHEPGYDIASMLEADMKEYGKYWSVYQRSKGVKDIGAVPYIDVALDTGADAGGVPSIIRLVNSEWLAPTLLQSAKPLNHFADYMIAYHTKSVEIKVDVKAVLDEYRAAVKSASQGAELDRKEANSGYTTLREFASLHPQMEYAAEMWYQLHSNGNGSTVVATNGESTWIPKASAVFIAYLDSILNLGIKERSIFKVYGVGVTEAGIALTKYIAVHGTATIPVSVTAAVPGESKSQLYWHSSSNGTVKVGGTDSAPGNYKVTLTAYPTATGVSKSTLTMTVITLMSNLVADAVPVAA